ncbi:hypothetical protein P8452_15086 [Trifolium repens]|nr:hypothetical protein P8452_15086 [Trifolium repens]
MKNNNKLTSSNFEMKQRVLTALNKVGDRDTHQIGTKELDIILHALTPQSISSFLSCILDIHSQQKTSITKQCLKLMSTLATVYQSLILPHLPKMVSSVVKCFRDPDSSVREACVEMVAVLASKLSNNNEDKVFVLLASPIFEALVGEQNKHVQSVSAFCLATIIHNTHHPPLPLLHNILTRILKLLKNPHFMAKPALIELNRSIIQAGGASTQTVLSAAIAGIRDALKDTDWKTRKAASVALGQIALTRASFLSSLRPSCIQSLDSSRFDKVKPVRDAVLQALKYWKILPGHYTTEPSETGSSLKENICGGDSVDLSSSTTTAESRHRDVKLQKGNKKSTMGRIPLSVRKACQNDVGHLHHPKTDDWHIEVAVPRTYSQVEFHNEEFESSSVTKPLETVSADITSMQDVDYDYVPTDDKQECSSVSNYETKFLTSHDCFVDNGRQKPIGRSQQFGEEISCNEQMYSIKMQNPKSSDSTVTESSPQTAHQCCVLRANEMTCIQNQLSDIEIKQANMMHQLQIFTTGIMDALSTIQSRMVGLENVIDRLSQESLKGERHSFSENSKFVRQTQSAASPRISICTPKPSSETSTKQSGLFSVKSTESLEKKSSSRSKPRIHAGDSVDMWKSYKVKTAHKFTEDIINSSGEDRQSTSSAPVRKNGSIFSSAARTNARNGCHESNTNYWKCVNRLVCEGDLNSAYMEALCSGDELILIELLNKTGPVIESLSVKTVNVVEMSTVHGPNCIALSIEVEEQLLYAIQEAVNLNIFSHAEKRRAAELAIKLHHMWIRITES